MYETLIFGLIAFVILVVLFTLMVRINDKLQKENQNLLIEIDELKLSNKELIEVNIALTSKNSLNLNEFGMSKNKLK